MDGLAKKFSQIGSSMLLCLLFIVAIGVTADLAGGVSRVEIVVGLVILVVLLRLNFWRIDRKFATRYPSLPD